MHVVFTSDGVEVPASRYRIMQFLPHFERAGVRCDVIHGYGSAYNRVHATPILGSAYKLVTRLGRAARTAVASADVIFLQRTALPQTAVAERIAHRRGQRLIFDFDDAIYLGPGGVHSAAREAAFRDTVRVADHCIAGNQHLAEIANVPGKTTVIPTVIDTDRYIPVDRSDRSELIIGWMGTAGNFPFLTDLAPALRKTLDRVPRAKVRLVSNANFEPLADHPRVEQIRWSAADEIALLQSFDIGLMPLHDTPLTRGKCAFKMIQYMAVGIPVVVSAVGANVEVMSDIDMGVALDGFDWADALVSLCGDADLRAAQGAAARERATSHYSVSGVLDRYLELFRAVAP